MENLQIEWLQIIWFILWGVLWGVYFMLDGYDFGISMWLPILGASSEKERTAMYQVTGPFWDGNEVWLITAGGVTFAAFPIAYAVLFSSLYTPLLILLFCLIIRGVVFELRFQVVHRYYRMICDGLGCLTSAVAAILLGVAFSNLFRGLPLVYDADKQFSMFQGNILNLLHPYCILGGVLFLLIFLVHGALYLTYRVEGDLKTKAFYMAKVTWPIFLIVFLVYVAFTFFWAFWPRLGDNFLASPLLFALPALCAVLFLATGYYMYFKNSPGRAFLASCGGILTLTLTGVIGMFPNLIPSRIDPKGAMNLVNSSSSNPTLTIMLVVAVIMVPTVIIYQIWAHKKMAWTIKADY
ncbi:MAG: cytochrome d ubiquinol oxidase subunit II [Deltaproteobacteria bacterium]|jgi:cytochrome d ubiquinol oxidase subunit II|nr:cytochrome d ubiquinol oxidase subunit II [Deltaproteobacteria bacterium]